MKPSASQPYTISRIRLINFHNLVNETIPVAEGGHLFLLGDNGSGKTTILDAVHYVLSAGESMEFNAAARITGRQQAEGRRLQGVIMRQNVDVGALNKTGGVTYAALEIRGRLGRPMTIGIGMSVGSLEESVQRWGIIRECPLEEIPFLDNDLNGTRPRTRDEMKQALGDGSGFYNIGAYRAEIASRLFGGDELFGEVCEFLKMGKAYREIAARAADYHELFKSLLPEPKTELFDRIIKAMKDLDGSRGDLENLERKAVYLQDLEQLISRVEAARDDRSRYQWLIPHLELEEMAGRRRRLEAEVAQLQEDLARQGQAEAGKNLEMVDLRRRLGDLHTKDPNGLVRQEKECAADLERAEAVLAKRQTDLSQAEKRQRDAQKQWHKSREWFADRVRKAQDELGTMASSLPFPLTDLLGTLDVAHRAEMTIDPSALLRGLPIPGMVSQAEAELSSVRTRIAQAETRMAEAQQRAAEARRVVEELEKQAEAMPEIPGFPEAQQHLRNALLEIQPLYKGLEWKLGLAPTTMAAVEEMIGDAVLGTLLVQERDWEAVRTLVYGDFPALRVALANPSAIGRTELPSWMQENFDLAKSDPQALECLAREMESGHEPQAGKWQQWPVGSFRAHERRLLQKSPRLIGSERRQQEWRRQLQIRRQESQDCQKQLRAVELQLEDGNKARLTLERFQALLRQHQDNLKSAADQAGQQRLELQYIENALVRQRTEYDGAGAEEKRLRTRLVEMRALIARENLDKLEQKIQALQRQIKKGEEELSELASLRGRLELRIETARTSLLGLQEQAAAAEVRRRQLQETVAARHPELAPESIPDYILRLRKGQQFKTVEAVHKAEAEAGRDETEAMTRLDEKMKDPTLGASYNFHYDTEANRLQDRRGQPLADVSIDLQQKLKGQRELINDQTRELFKKIIMTELVDFLKHHVSRLNDMVKRVNQVLSTRDFGGKRYHLLLTPIPGHRHILDIVRNYNHFASTATEGDLRAFFDDHKDEILSADVDRIPAVLDYRNWYQYEMRMESSGTEGVVMDRRTKSIGSGGEQAVPNYLLILTIAHFLYRATEIKLHALLFDEAFYGIDASRRDQILGFATDLGLQLLVTSPDQDGVKREIRHSTSVLVVKDKDYNVHLYPFVYENKELPRQLDLLNPEKDVAPPAEFGAELTPDARP